MKPPRGIDFEPTSAGDPLALLVAAVETGRLVALLRGEGLTRNTVAELLEPGSAARLRFMLNRRVFTERESNDPDREIRSGEVLVFKARETRRP